MTKEDENRIDKAAKEYGGKSPFLVSSYYIGAVAEHEYLTRQLEEKDKEIDKWRSMAKLSEQSTIGLMKQMEEQAAEIESLRKEITLKDGIISDHAESILELRKENEELKRIKREWEEVAGPLLEYGRINSDQLGIKLGDSITDGILKFLTEYNQTKKA